MGEKREGAAAEAGAAEAGEKREGATVEADPEPKRERGSEDEEAAPALEADVDLRSTSTFQSGLD